MKDFEVNIDHDLVEKKVLEIGEVIDGLTLPHVMCIIGAVIVELVINVRRDGIDVAGVIINWLQLLIKNVAELQTMEEEELVN